MSSSERESAGICSDGCLIPKSTFSPYVLNSYLSLSLSLSSYYCGMLCSVVMILCRRSLSARLLNAVYPAWSPQRLPVLFSQPAIADLPDDAHRSSSVMARI